MNCFKYLRDTFRFYLISGIVFAFVVSLLIIVYRYNGYLVDKLHTAEDISINTEKIKNQTDEMDTVIKYLRDGLNLDVTDINYERLILQTLDNIKTRIKGVSLMVTTFEEAEDQKRLPVEIKVPVKTYKEVLDYMQYIESFRIPEYKIDQISISRGQKGNIILEIKGVIAMPSFSPQEGQLYGQ